MKFEERDNFFLSFLKWNLCKLCIILIGKNLKKISKNCPTFPKNGEVFK